MAGAVRLHGPSRRSDLNAVLVEQLVIVQHHRPTSFPLFQVVGVFRGRGRRYSTLAPARIGWARPACQGGRSGYGPKALGRLFRSHRVHASRRLEQRAQRAIPVWSRSAGVERPDGGGAVVGGREAPGAVAVEPSVLHHTFGEQSVGAVARPPQGPVGRGHQTAQQTLLLTSSPQPKPGDSLRRPDSKGTSGLRK